MELAQDKGASNWLTTLPIYGFSQSKSEFRDVLSQRCGWLPERMPSKCVCSENFTIDHALNCHCGAFPTIRLNEIRNLTGILLTEVCHDISLEPVLQPLTGEVLNHATANQEDEARADIAVRNFWGNGHKAFFDVKVFNPCAKSNQKFALSSCFTHQKREPMNNGYLRLNTGRSPHSFSVPHVVWAKQTKYIKIMLLTPPPTAQPAKVLFPKH